jgi:hypothetical protein
MIQNRDTRGGLQAVHSSDSIAKIVERHALH